MQGANNTQAQEHPHIKDIIHGWSRQRYYPEMYVAYDDHVRRINITAICENGTNWHIPISYVVESDVNCVERSSIIWMQCNESKIIYNQKLVLTGITILNLLQIGE